MSAERLEVATSCLQGLLGALPESIITNRKMICDQADSYAECALSLADSLIDKAQEE